MKVIKGEHLEKPRILNPYCFSEYTEKSCYWAGFLAADGCISNGSLYICLHSQDLDHIQKFQSFVGSNHKISVNTDKYDRAQTAFVNKQINKDLLYNFNITERKTETYELPIIPDKFFWNFVRGYFDGDGCICESFSNKNSKTATLYTTIVGSYTLIDELYPLLELNGTVQTKAKVKVIKYCTNSSRRFLSNIYSNSTENLRLSRKYNYYLDILNRGIKTR